jgi:hypothetical protein
MYIGTPNCHMQVTYYTDNQFHMCKHVHKRTHTQEAQEGVTIVSGASVLEGRPGVWTSSAVGSGTWQRAESISACVRSGFAFAGQSPWCMAGTGALELALACLNDPFGSEASVFLRSNEFLNSRRWKAMALDKSLPISAQMCICANGSEDAQITATEVLGLVRRIAEGTIGCLHEYIGVLDKYEFDIYSVLSIYLKAKKLVDAKEDEIRKAREKILHAYIEKGALKVEEEWFAEWSKGSLHDMFLQVHIGTHAGVHTHTHTCALSQKHASLDIACIHLYMCTHTHSTRIHTCTQINEEFMTCRTCPKRDCTCLNLIKLD